MTGDLLSRLKTTVLPLILIACTPIAFQGCHSHSQIKTGDTGRPELQGSEILRHGEEKDRFEDELIIYLQQDAALWRDMAQHLSAALDSLNAYVRDSTTASRPGDFQPKDCPGSDCAAAEVPGGTCKIRPDCG